MLDIKKKQVFGHVFPVIWVTHEGVEYIMVFDDTSIFPEKDWIEVIDGVPHICREIDIRAKRTDDPIPHIFKFAPAKFYEPVDWQWGMALDYADYLDRTFSTRMMKNFNEHPEMWGSCTATIQEDGSIEIDPVTRFTEPM